MIVFFILNYLKMLNSYIFLTNESWFRSVLNLVLTFVLKSFNVVTRRQLGWSPATPVTLYQKLYDIPLSKSVQDYKR